MDVETDPPIGTEKRVVDGRRRAAAGTSAPIAAEASTAAEAPRVGLRRDRPRITTEARVR